MGTVYFFCSRTDGDKTVCVWNIVLDTGKLLCGLNRTAVNGMRRKYTTRPNKVDPFQNLRRLADAARSSASEFELWSNSNFQGDRPKASGHDFVGWVVLKQDPETAEHVPYRVDKVLLTGGKRSTNNPEIQLYDAYDDSGNQHRFSFDDLMSARLAYNKNNIEFVAKVAKETVDLVKDADCELSDDPGKVSMKRKQMQLPFASKSKGRLFDSTNQQFRTTAFVKPPPLFECRKARHDCWTFCRLVAPSETLPDGKEHWENADAKQAYCLKCKTLIQYERSNPRDVIKHYDAKHKTQEEEPAPPAMNPPLYQMQQSIPFAHAPFETQPIQQDQQERWELYQEFMQYRQFLQMQKQQSQEEQQSEE
jgi:hypothetical protein